jgi:hypothetical protein
MDPIHPIAPGPPALPRVGSLPVERLERISRERDRPSKNQQDTKRRAPRDRDQRGSGDGERGEDDGEPRHIDVRA